MEQSLNHEVNNSMLELYKTIIERLNVIENSITEHTPKDLLTSKEAARYLNVKMDWFNKLCSQEQLSYTKPGGKNRVFKKSDLDKYLKRNLRTSDPDLD